MVMSWKFSISIAYKILFEPNKLYMPPSEDTLRKQAQEIKTPVAENLNNLLTEKVYKSKSYLHKRNRLEFIIKYNVCDVCSAIKCLYCLLMPWLLSIPFITFNTLHS